MSYTRHDMIFKEYLQGAIAINVRDYYQRTNVVTLENSRYRLEFDGDYTLILGGQVQCYTVLRARNGTMTLLDRDDRVLPLRDQDIEHLTAYFDKNQGNKVFVPPMNMSEFEEAIKQLELHGIIKTQGDDDE